MKVDPRYLTDGWRYAHGYYSDYSDYNGGAMCKEGKLIDDGHMTTVACNIKGDYANCETCEHNPHYNSFIEQPTYKYPKFHYSFKPIPSYCIDCQNKNICKNIQSGIEWCPDKEELYHQ